MGWEKEINFILLNRKERERERVERGRNSSYFCECMTENLKYIESQDFGLKREEMCWTVLQHPVFPLNSLNKIIIFNITNSVDTLTQSPGRQ